MIRLNKEELIMNNTLLHDLLHYGEVISDYEFEDKQKGCMRVRQIKDVSFTQYVFTVVQVNGEYISVSMNMEF